MPELNGKELKEFFDCNGFLHIPSFCSKEECDKMMNRMAELIASWDPDKTMSPIFTTDQQEQEKAQGSSDYFLDSADRIHFFLEKEATDESGKLKKGKLKQRSLNKVGHGLHVVDEVFKEYSFSTKVCQLAQDLGWRNPVLPQSMYIFKQPLIGGEVTSHQDSTFLYTTPRVSCLGLWLALQDATLENGCIWARPGSHKEPVRRIFCRNPEHFEKGVETAPQMIFRDFDPEHASKVWEWEGKMPEGSEPPSQGLYEKGFKPLECKAGDLIVIHGSVDHMSLPNVSEKERQTYQLHMVEGPKQGITWSPGNWLQYPNRRPFPELVPQTSTKRKVDEAGL